MDASCNSASASAFGLDVYSFPAAAVVRVDPKRLSGAQFRGAPTAANVADFVKRVKGTGGGGKPGVAVSQQPLEARAVASANFEKCVAASDGERAPTGVNDDAAIDGEDDIMEQVRIQVEREEKERREMLMEAKVRSQEIKRESAAEGVFCSFVVVVVVARYEYE